MSKPAAPQIALCAASPIPAAAEGTTVPTRIHLLPAGQMSTVDGRGPFRIVNPDDVIRFSMAGGNRLPIDENHATDLAAPRGEPAPARGWITALHAQADGIWGDVEWTEAGRQLVADKAYRAISPAVAYQRDGTVLGVVRASLVNLPNLRGLVALHQQQEHQMDLLAQLRTLLGLPDTADEAAVLSAIKGGVASVATHAAQIAPIAKAVGLQEDADHALILQTVQTLADPAKTVPAQALITLQSEMQTLVGGLRREKAEAAVDAAIAAGKIASPQVMRDHYIARHMAEPAAVDKELGAMISLHGATGASSQPPKFDAAGKQILDGAEASIVALMGISTEAYAKTKAAQGLHEGAL